MNRAGTRAVPSPPASLERFRRDLEQCVRCGMCRAVCPPFLTGKSEAHAARGRMALAAAVLDGRLSASAAFKDRLMTCAGCLACEAACPCGVPVASIVEAAKEEAVRESGLSLIERTLGGVFSSGTALRSLAWLAPAVLRYRPGEAGGSIPLLPSRSFTASLPDVVAAERGPARVTGPSRVALFAGCAVNHMQQDVGRAALSVLTALGCDVVIPKGEVCCGRPMLSLGDRETAAELARKNAALLARLDVDAVVTVCASCGLTLKKEYPALLPGVLMPPVRDVHEIIRERLSGAALAPVAGNESYTYHVPCHLGRGQGLGTSFRDVLHAVPGLAVRKPEHPEQCCGFGGVMRVTHRSLSVEIGREKAKDLIVTGASVVVTGCPGCRLQLSDELRRAGSKARVVHTVQVLEKVLGSAELRGRSAEREKTGPKVKGTGPGK